MLIAGPNLTIDRTARIPELRPGAVLRVTEVVVTPGGKGLNVARAARSLGVPALLLAFLPGRTGQAAGALIAGEGVALRGLDAPGEIRSTGVFLEDGGRTTVINEPGPLLPPRRWEALEEAAADELESHGVLVCSGSLPPGAPTDGYGRLVAQAQAAARRVIVDANGPVLDAAVKAGADVVTPNLAEAEGLLHGHADEAVEAAPDARERALAAAEELVRHGARGAVVTAAAAGAALAGPEPAWLPAPRVTVRNPIGAGDVFAAALGAALERGAELPEAAREAIAAAAASVESPTAGELDPDRMRQLMA
jgi:1-phosphofructokinase family hexose kinase